MKKSITFTLTLIIATILFSYSSFAQEDKRDSNSPYGVLEFLVWNHDWNYYHYDTQEKLLLAADLMKDAGIGFVRIDFLWADIEPVEGKFDFKKYDLIVDILASRGISVLGLLHYNPLWRGGSWNSAPNQDLYVKYAQATVAHFKKRVKYWEIWNEPDEAQYWMPQDNLTSYSKLLKQVYLAIKSIDPTSKVLMGGVSSDIADSLNNLYNNGCKDYFDIVNIHPFTNPLCEDPVDGVSKIYEDAISIMEQYDDQNKKIWITEIGSPGVKTPNKRNGWWCGDSPTEKEQAAWLNQIYTNCLSWPNVEKVFWAFFRDTDGHFKSGIDKFGLVRLDFSKKPSYHAYKKVTNSK